MTTPEAYLLEMEADEIPEGESGLWMVKRYNFCKDKVKAYADLNKGREVKNQTHVFLMRYTDSTLYNGGECVMEDTPTELRKHLQFVMQAHGRVLVTGLGLGCVTRGLLANPNVTAVDVVEISEDVLTLVEDHMPKVDRLRIIWEDAFKYTNRTDLNYDCAWHDLWTDRDAGEPHLQVWHQQLMFNCRRQIPFQGAWAFPNNKKTILDRLNFVKQLERVHRHV